MLGKNAPHSGGSVPVTIDGHLLTRSLYARPDTTAAAARSPMSSSCSAPDMGGTCEAVALARMTLTDAPKAAARASHWARVMP